MLCSISGMAKEFCISNLGSFVWCYCSVFKDLKSRGVTFLLVALDKIYKMVSSFIYSDNFTPLTTSIMRSCYCENVTHSFILGVIFGGTKHQSFRSIQNHFPFLLFYFSLKEAYRSWSHSLTVLYPSFYTFHLSWVEAHRSLTHFPSRSSFIHSLTVKLWVFFNPGLVLFFFLHSEWKLPIKIQTTSHWFLRRWLCCCCCWFSFIVDFFSF